LISLRVRPSWIAVVALTATLNGCATTRSPVGTRSAVPPGTVETGEASWYGERHQGRRTANGEPFAVLLGDDLIHESVPLLSDMLRTSTERRASVVAAMEVSDKEISFYGCITPEPIDERLSRVLDIVEKPAPGEAASNLAVIGRYVFTSDIFDALRETKPGRGGEIQLTDAINLLAHRETVYSYSFDKGRFDVGNKLDYLKATVEFALEREDLGSDLRGYLSQLAKREGLL
jgi:UTP--glucose-1-phosphate uridylyltransferase